MEAQEAIRHEFYDGNLYEMPGNTILHERMIKSLSKILEALIAFMNFEIYSKDIKIMTPDNKAIFYPNLVMVSINDQDEHSYVAKNPILIIEVLSDTTR